MAARFLTGIIFTFLAPMLLYGQGEFGIKAATTLYQPQYDLGATFPRPGVAVGGISKFQVTDNPQHRVQVEFGYLMGNSNINFDPDRMLLKYTFGPNDRITDANLLMHFLNAYIGYEWNLTGNNDYSFTIGPDVTYMFARTFVIEVEYANDPDSRQNLFTGGRVDDLDEYFLNIRWGGEVKLKDTGNSLFMLYLNFIHQVDQRPYLPAGGLLGVKMYFRSLTRN